MDRGGQRDGSPGLLGEEFQGVNQCGGVRPRLMRDELEDAAVAALFFEFT